MYHIFFIQSNVNGHLGFFHFLAVVNVSQWIFSSLFFSQTILNLIWKPSCRLNSWIVVNFLKRHRSTFIHFSRLMTVEHIQIILLLQRESKISWTIPAQPSNPYIFNQNDNILLLEKVRLGNTSADLSVLIESIVTFVRRLNTTVKKGWNRYPWSYSSFVFMLQFVNFLSPWSYFKVSLSY